MDVHDDGTFATHARVSATFRLQKGPFLCYNAQVVPSMHALHEALGMDRKEWKPMVRTAITIAQERYDEQYRLAFAEGDLSVVWATFGQVLDDGLLTAAGYDHATPPPRNARGRSKPVVTRSPRSRAGPSSLRRSGC